MESLKTSFGLNECVYRRSSAGLRRSLQCVCYGRKEECNSLLCHMVLTHPFNGCMWIETLRDIYKQAFVAEPRAEGDRI